MKKEPDFISGRYAAMSLVTPSFRGARQARVNESQGRVVVDVMRCTSRCTFKNTTSLVFATILFYARVTQVLSYGKFTFVRVQPVDEGDVEFGPACSSVRSCKVHRERVDHVVTTPKALVSVDRERPTERRGEVLWFEFRVGSEFDR